MERESGCKIEPEGEKSGRHERYERGNVDSDAGSEGVTGPIAESRRVDGRGPHATTVLMRCDGRNISGIEGTKQKEGCARDESRDEQRDCRLCREKSTERANATITALSPNRERATNCKRER